MNETAAFVIDQDQSLIILQTSRIIQKSNFLPKNQNLLTFVPFLYNRLKLQETKK